MKNIAGIIGEFPGNKRITTWHKIKWLPVTVLETLVSKATLLTLGLLY